MADFNYTPDEGMDESAEFKVTAVIFGDGYQQTIPKGINNALRKWSVTFSDRSKVEADAIRDFLVSKMGSTSFTWRPIGFAADVRVRCPRYSRPMQNRFKDGTFVYSVKADFEESPI